MIPLPFDDLLKTKDFLQRKISELDAQREMLREKLKAVETLLSAEVDPSGGPHAARSRTLVLAGEQTRSEEFRIPILEVLAELVGGRGRTDEVLGLVEKKMNETLTPKDRQSVPSGSEPRWRNWARWERKHMVQEGLLRGDSPHGIWEVTQQGKKWLERSGGESSGP